MTDLNLGGSQSSAQLSHSLASRHHLLVDHHIEYFRRPAGSVCGQRKRTAERQADPWHQATKSGVLTAKSAGILRSTGGVTPNLSLNVELL